MKVLTPASDLSIPLRRADGLLHRVLRGGEAYLVTDNTAAQVDGRLRSGLTAATLAEPPAPPFTLSPERKLLFFEGEEGDCSAALPTVLAAEGKFEVGFVSPLSSAFPLPFEVPVYEYPITVRQAGFYDAWIEVNVRLSPSDDPVETVARALGVEAPAEAPVVEIEHSLLVRSVESLFPQTERQRVGLAVYCDSHYRSWVPDQACCVMRDLVNAGCDCFVLGNAKKRLLFRHEGQFVNLWNAGIYDASGLFLSLEEQAAFLSLMDVVIAPDGGLLQLSCALGAPTLGLFGPTTGGSRSAHWPRLTWLDAEADCSPCWCRGDRPPCEGADCAAMRGIEREKIIAATLEILGAEEAHVP